MPFSQIIPLSPSPTESKRLFYTSVSLALASGFFFTMEIEKQMFGKQMFAEPAETMGHREDPDF